MLTTTILFAALIPGVDPRFQTEVQVVDADQPDRPVAGASIEIIAESGASGRIACGSTDAGGIFVTDELGPRKRPNLRAVYIRVIGFVVVESDRRSWVGNEFPQTIHLKLRKEPVSIYPTPAAQWQVACPEMPLYLESCGGGCSVRPVIRCCKPVVTPCPTSLTHPIYYIVPPCGCSPVPLSFGQPPAGHATPPQHYARTACEATTHSPLTAQHLPPPVAPTPIIQTQATAVYQPVALERPVWNTSPPLDAGGWRPAAP